jgi:hypothetical protein
LAERSAAAMMVVVMMDIGGMDVEDLQRRWRRARRAWDDIRQVKLARDIAGERLSAEEQARRHHARAEFEVVEDLWDQAYRAGVVVIVGGDEEDSDDPGPAGPESRRGG